MEDKAIVVKGPNAEFHDARRLSMFKNRTELTNTAVCSRNAHGVLSNGEVSQNYWYITGVRGKGGMLYGQMWEDSMSGRDPHEGTAELREVCKRKQHQTLPGDPDKLYVHPPPELKQFLSCFTHSGISKHLFCSCTSLGSSPDGVVFIVNFHFLATMLAF